MPSWLLYDLFEPSTLLDLSSTPFATMPPKRRNGSNQNNGYRGRSRSRGRSYNRDRDDSHDYLRDLVDKEKKKQQRAEEKKKQRREDRRFKKLASLVSRKHKGSDSDSSSTSSSSSSSSSSSGSSNSSVDRHARKAIRNAKRKAKRQQAKLQEQLAKLHEEVQQLKRAGQSSADRSAAALSQQQEAMQGLAESVLKQQVQDWIQQQAQHQEAKAVKASRRGKKKGKAAKATSAVESQQLESANSSDATSTDVSEPSPKPPAPKKQRKQRGQRHTAAAAATGDPAARPTAAGPATMTGPAASQVMIEEMLARLEQLERQHAEIPSSSRGPSAQQREQREQINQLERGLDDLLNAATDVREEQQQQRAAAATPRAPPRRAAAAGVAAAVAAEAEPVDGVPARTPATVRTPATARTAGSRRSAGQAGSTALQRLRRLPVAVCSAALESRSRSGTARMQTLRAAINSSFPGQRGVSGGNPGLHSTLRTFHPSLSGVPERNQAVTMLAMAIMEQLDQLSIEDRAGLEEDVAAQVESDGL